VILSDLREAIATQLQTVPNLTVSQFRVNAVQAPHAIISVPSGQYDSTMGRGSDTVTVQIIVLVSRADDETGLALLDEFVVGHGLRSIKTVVEQASGDGLSFVRVIGFEIGTTSAPDGSEYIAATFDAEAVVSGTA
jgi:hypothetical protein